MPGLACRVHRCRAEPMVQHDPHGPDREVAGQILGYFLRHPEVADSLEGIARWRLMQESVRQSVERTSEALKWLIAEGYIREEGRVASGRIFQLNPARRDAAQAFVERVRQRPLSPAQIQPTGSTEE